MSSLFLFHFSKRETKQRFFSNFVQCSFFSRKNQKRVYILFLFKKKQNQKKILYPLLPLLHKRGQPLLLVALTLRYARTIKGPAWVFYIINKHGVVPPYKNIGGSCVCATTSFSPSYRRGWGWWMFLLVLFFAPKKRTDEVWRYPPIWTKFEKDKKKVMKK